MNAKMVNTVLKERKAYTQKPAARIRAEYERLKDNDPSLRARNAAAKMGLSEGELVAAHVGFRNTRLVCDPYTVLPAVKSLGEVMALTRNEACVHERKGVYDNFHSMNHGKLRMGQFVNADIDLRLFFNYWEHAFAVNEGPPHAPRRSLQFFDKAGEAVHKIYLTNHSLEDAYHALVEEYKNEDQSDGMIPLAYDPPAADLPDSEIDWTGFRTAWENLKDTHDFFPMLRKFKTGRQQAFRHIGEDFAYPVQHDAARLTLESARDRDCDIMVFVGNKGCIQIHSGPVEKLVQHGPWYNVLDPMFNLHLRTDMIAESWVTRKPTEDGIVTALELFAADGSIIATFFGRRKPGIPELTRWREIVADLPKMEEER
jgi:putative hemin transport protein